MNQTTDNNWTENIILVDADYLDRVALNLQCNFERMLERRIAQADLARWAECAALDGGLRQGDHHTHLILLHNQHHKELRHFVPSSYEGELGGQAFSGPLGEFSIAAVPTTELADMGQLYADTLDFLLGQDAIRRLVLVPDAEDANIYNKVRETVRHHADGGTRHITLLAMQPMAGWTERQEILGYSLMSALGISAAELNEKMKQER